jgi:phospholipid/cholesterol/gamma-HCH transport system permease protein
MITGAFVGMTLAVQIYDQLAGMGLEEHMGALINVSVVKELGPVLAAVMLAGRIGGALTAELGTMNVTEQIDAIRSMGTDPIRYLVEGLFFGGAIASISCYKGFHCKEGAEGVGRACTEAFVASFITILALDFALAVIFKAIYSTLWPLRIML